MEITSTNVEVVCGAPSIHLPLALGSLRQDWSCAAQNCGSNKKQGAHTGEICADQLVDLGVKWVILGHSECRERGESSPLVAEKVKAAVASGLSVMLCIGEKLEERENGTTMEVCAEQLAACSSALEPAEWGKVAVAYEPVWAIGTGKTATPAMAQETHSQIRDWLASNVNPDVAQATRILYGGSMKGANAKDLLAQDDIDGGLIGGASLTADFGNVVNGVAA